MNTQPHYGGVPILNHDSDHEVQDTRNRIAQQWGSLTHPESPMLTGDLAQLAREIRESYGRL